jgi:hypothetical protein
LPSLRALGAGSIVLLASSYLTALAYLASQAGIPIALPISRIDVVHVAAGIGAAVFAVCVIARIRHRSRTWSSWMRGLLLAASVLYAGVLVTGVLILLPLSGALRDELTQAHLIASVWAAEPALVLLYELRRRGDVPGFRRLGRFWPALAALLALAPAIAIAGVAPRALSPDAARGGHQSWQPFGPRAFIDQMASAPAGRSVIAGGLGLFAVGADGRWRPLAPFSADLINGLLVTPGAAVYVGTERGLFRAPSANGRFQHLPLRATAIHGIAVFEHGSIIWASSDQGFWRSDDAGSHWHAEDAGVAVPDSAWALFADQGTLFASDVTGVYRWAGDRWVRESRQPDVYSFTRAPDGRLFASAMGGGVWVRDRGHWKESDAGLVTHNQGQLQGIHEISVTFADGRVYGGSMLAGADVSLDGGTTWSQQWPGLSREGDVWRILPLGDDLVAATDHGLFRYDLSNTARASLWWWLLTVGATGTAAVLVATALARAHWQFGIRA